jgi:hypothetical protein
MNRAANDGELNEPSLIKLYMDLTGMSETCARNVYMFISGDNEEESKDSNDLDRWRVQTTEFQIATAKNSPVPAKKDQEFDIGLLSGDNLAFTGN